MAPYWTVFVSVVVEVDVSLYEADSSELPTLLGELRVTFAPMVQPLVVPMATAVEKDDVMVASLVPSLMRVASVWMFVVMVTRSGAEARICRCQKSVVVHSNACAGHVYSFSLEPSVKGGLFWSTVRRDCCSWLMKLGSWLLGLAALGAAEQAPMRRERDTRANIVESGSDKGSSYDGFGELGSREEGLRLCCVGRCLSRLEGNIQGKYAAWFIYFWFGDLQLNRARQHQDKPSNYPCNST